FCSLESHHTPFLPPFPYTTLFRSVHLQAGQVLEGGDGCAGGQEVAAFHLAEADASGEGGLHLALLQGRAQLFDASLGLLRLGVQDRKSTRLNSSHVKNSYADFCLK